MAKVDKSAGFPEWESFTEALGPAGERCRELLWEANDGQVRQELACQLLAALAQGYVAHVHAHPDYPEFFPALGLPFNLGAPVPDFMYTGALISGDGTYRLSGNRGTALFVDMNVNRGYWASGNAGPTLNAYTLDDVEIAENGDFEVILSGERPQGYDGDWWYLNPEGSRLSVRRASYDWLDGIDANLTIDRLDRPARRPRPSREEIARRMDHLPYWVETAVKTWLRHLNEQRARAPLNDVARQDWSHMGGARGQIYFEGMFDLAPDEALFIESDVPEICRYWSFLVANELFATLDWMNRFSSINGNQAVLSADGRFRVVISARDPGVPNWIDIGDYERGIIQVRWNNANSAPEPRCARIKCDDVWTHMPANTQRVTPDERDAALRLRRKGAQLRRFW